MAGAEYSNLKAWWSGGSLVIGTTSGDTLMVLNPSTGGFSIYPNGLTVSGGLTTYGGLTVASTGPTFQATLTASSANFTGAITVTSTSTFTGGVVGSLAVSTSVTASSGIFTGSLSVTSTSTFTLGVVGGLTVSGGETVYSGLVVSSGISVYGGLVTAVQVATTVANSTGPSYSTSTDGVTFTLPTVSTYPNTAFTFYNLSPAGSNFMRIITATTNYFAGYGMQTGSTGNSVMRNTSTNHVKGDYIAIIGTMSTNVTWNVVDMVGTWTMGAAT